MRQSAFSILVMGLLLVGVFPFFVHAANSCNDIDILTSDVTFQENKDGKSITFTLENNGDDQFEIDDVKIEENSPYFDLSLEEFPDEINDGKTGKIRLEYTTGDINSDKEDSFQIKVKGEFDDDDNKECSFNNLTFNIDVTIEDGENICSLMTIQADDVSISENDTFTHTITVTNDTDEDFTLQDFDVFDDSSSFTVSFDPKFNDSEFEKVIPANSSQNYDVKIKSQSVDGDETDTAFLELRGEFENGSDCSFSEIESEFEITVEDEGTDTVVCSNIALDAPTIYIHGNETIQDAISISNKSSQNFFVDEVNINDSNYQVSFETLDTPEKVPFSESDIITFSATGYSYPDSFDGNATISMKGHFTSGSTCFVSGKKIPFQYIGTNGGVCSDFYSNLPTVTVLKGTQTKDIFLNNPLNQPATVKFTMTGGQVSPNIVYLPANTAKTQTVFFSNVNENQTLTMTADIPGCTTITQQSVVLFSGLDDAPVQFVNAPSVLTIGNAKEFALQVKNKSAYTQEVQITLITKPGTQSYSQTTSIPGLDEPLIFLPTNILQGKSSVIIQLKSAGYIVTHTMQLNNISAIVVIPEVNENPTVQNEYEVNVTVQNPTPQPVEGEIIVDVPNDWIVSGNTNMHLAPFESKTVSLTVKPDHVLSSPFQTHVYFNGSPHSSNGKGIAFNPPSNPLSATALAIGTSGLWAGILVLLILLVAWQVAKPKGLGDDEVKETFLIPIKPTSKPVDKGSILDEMDFEEPWMHPEKNQ